MDLRPKLHFTTKQNWMNDPNGFCFFKGKYHLYFQYNPYAKVWGNIHWGHAVSDDLIHWQEEPVVMAPEFEFEAQGVFSGSVLIENDLQYFYYTGVRYMDETKEISHTYQTVGYARSEDGYHLKKLPEPILLPDPDHVEVTEFRDPKIWQHEGQTYMVIGGSYKGKGRALIYHKEADGGWQIFTVLTKENSGRVWECPDIVKVGDQLFLTASLMDIHYGGRQHVAMIAALDLDYKTGEYAIGDFEPMDYGLDFYAAQSIALADIQEDPITIGWLRMDDSLSKSCAWSGIQSLPRQMCLENDRLVYRLPEALEQASWQNVEVTGDRIQVPTQTYMMKGIMELTEDFSFDLFSDGESGFRIGYDSDRRQIYADRSAVIADAPGLQGALERVWLPATDEKMMDFTLVADRSVIEIFIDGGVQVMTLVMSPDDRQTAIDLRKVKGNLAVTELKYIND